MLPGLLKTSYINPNTLMISREVMERVGFWNETGYYPEDWEYCLRNALAGYEIGNIPEALAVVQVRPGSNTTLQSDLILKANAVAMFERLFPANVGGVTYSAEPVLRSLRLRLGLAYLANGKTREAARALGLAFDNRGVGWVAAMALAPVLRTVLERR